MKCSEVVAGFTDYLDGRSSEAERGAIEEHLERCTGCMRYRRVIVRGAEFLRSLPEADVHDDFAARLEHRLYHVDEERALGVHAASRTPAMTVASIALFLTGVAWSPTLFRGSPTDHLPDVVVEQQPPDFANPRVLTPPPVMLPAVASKPAMDDGLWANQLIYDYSPLSERYQRRSSVRRVGQLDR